MTQFKAYLLQREGIERFVFANADNQLFSPTGTGSHHEGEPGELVNVGLVLQGRNRVGWDPRNQRTDDLYDLGDQVEIINRAITNDSFAYRCLYKGVVKANATLRPIDFFSTIDRYKLIKKDDPKATLLDAFDQRLLGLTKTSKGPSNVEISLGFWMYEEGSKTDIHFSDPRNPSFILDSKTFIRRGIVRPVIDLDHPLSNPVYVNGEIITPETQDRVSRMHGQLEPLENGAVYTHLVNRTGTARLRDSECTYVWSKGERLFLEKGDTLLLGAHKTHVHNPTPWHHLHDSAHIYVAIGDEIHSQSITGDELDLLETPAITELDDFGNLKQRREPSLRENWKTTLAVLTVGAILGGTAAYVLRYL